MLRAVSTEAAVPVNRNSLSGIYICSYNHKNDLLVWRPVLLRSYTCTAFISSFRACIFFALCWNLWFSI